VDQIISHAQGLTRHGEGHNEKGPPVDRRALIHVIQRGSEFVDCAHRDRIEIDRRAVCATGVVAAQIAEQVFRANNEIVGDRLVYADAVVDAANIPFAAGNGGFIAVFAHRVAQDAIDQEIAGCITDAALRSIMSVTCAVGKPVTTVSCAEPNANSPP
jgi:hypothetical protein